MVEASIVAELDDLDLLVTADRPQPRKLTYGDLNKLVYLQAVVKVSLPPPSGGTSPSSAWGSAHHHIRTVGQPHVIYTSDKMSTELAPLPQAVAAWIVLWPK